MSGQLGELVISLSADIARFQADMGKAVKSAETAANQMTAGLNVIPEMFGKIGTAAAGVAAILGGGAMFGAAISATKDVAAEVTKLSKVFGVTAEDASVLRVALDDAFLSVDDAVGASDRLTRASIKNSAAFTKVGIDIRDSNGSLKDSLSIMMEVNDYLLKLKEGKERDTVAMALYGKGWRELSGILRLNSEGLKEAKDRAEELHIIFGDDKIAAVKKYKSAMKDIDDVAESLKVTIGNELIPVLTDLAVQFGDVGTSAAGAFARISKTFITEVQTSKAWWGKTISNIMAFPGAEMIVGEKRYKEYLAEVKANDAMYQYTLQDIANKRGGITTDIVKARNRKPDTGGRAPDMTPEKDDTQSWVTAHEKYLSYLKAWSAKNSEIVKQTAAYEDELNRQAWAWGLIGLQSYLDKKHAIQEQALQNEITIAKDEVKKYQDEVSKYQGKTDAKSANAYHDALAKQEDANKRLITLQGQLKVARSQNDDEYTKALYGQNKNLIDLSAQVLELTGHYWQAAEARAAFFRNDKEYKQLSAPERAEKDKLLGYDLRKAAITDTTTHANMVLADISNGMAEIQALRSTYGISETEEAQRRINLLALEREEQQKIYDSIKGGEPEMESLRLRAKSQILGIDQELINQHKIISDHTAFGGMMDALRKYGEEAKNIGADISSAVTNVLYTMEDALVDFVTKGKADFSKLVDSIIADLARIAIRQTITAPLADGLGGWIKTGIGFLGGMFGSGGMETIDAGPQTILKRADGGPVTAGQSYWVGERGIPELFTPGASGFITPMAAVGAGSSMSISIPISIDGGGSKQMVSDLRREMEDTAIRVIRRHS